jgi:hypothetical protein
MSMPPSMTPAEMTSASRTACAGREVCHVLGYADTDRVSGRDQLKRDPHDMSFYYSAPAPLREEIALWDCKLWPRPRDECLG